MAKNPNRPAAEQIFIYDPVNGIDERESLLALIGVPWAVIPAAYKKLVNSQIRGEINGKVQYAALTTINGHRVRIKYRQTAEGTPFWTIKVQKPKRGTRQ
jgi:hypothetical protein